jgi:pimeloyl-ACP methyl ester carboxylesterase
MFESFAQDLTEIEKGVMFAVQGPTSVNALGGNVTKPAWRTKPSWYMVASNDRAIPPELEASLANKIGAKETISVAASHVVMLSQPSKVADWILKAADLAVKAAA